ncbi:hypothetical protein ACFLU5_12805 [Bacteroidota bacterium]
MKNREVEIMKKILGIKSSTLSFLTANSKKYHIHLLFVFLLFIGSCGDKCDEDCGACAELDTETCECIVDIDCRCSDRKQDGNEAWIDCGGDCDPCTCEFDPCLFLTAGSEKTWKYVSTVDPNGNPYEPTQCDLNWTYTFQVNHVIEMGCPSVEHLLFIWTLDDPELAIEMVFTDGLGRQYSYGLKKLTVDTLIIEENIGTSLYIPK